MHEPPALVPGFALVYCAAAGLVSGLQRIAIQIGTGAGTGLMLAAVAFALPLGNSIHRQCLGNVGVIGFAQFTWRNMQIADLADRFSNSVVVGASSAEGHHCPRIG